MKVVNSLGTYKSEMMEVTEGQFSELVEMSKLFWITDTSFSIWTDNGAVIFPPDIVSKSILIIEKIE
jgi:hypothetical protein